jgi:transposase
MYHIGIDVAKDHHDALGLDDAGRIILPAFRFSNTRAGVEELIARLKALNGEVRLAMESTGHYWVALYEYLVDRSYAVTVFNPLQIRAYRQVGIRKAKTDRIDSYYIADFLRVRVTAAVMVPSATRRQLRHLARFRFALTDRSSGLRRRAHMVLDQVFPEYPALFARPFDTTSRQLLRQAVTAEEFAAWPLDDLTVAIHQASRGRLGQEKAQAIYTAAHTSLGIRSLTRVAKQEMACLLHQMDLLDQQIETIDQTLSELLASEPQYLTTIPGIGTVLAATILGEIGDIHRFASLKPLVAFAGFDPTVYQSGQFQATQTTLSKRGSPYLRRAIWLAATSARLYNPDLAAFYQRKRDQGKHHNTTMAAVCHRLLARIYVVLPIGPPWGKEQRPFQVR